MFWVMNMNYATIGTSWITQSYIKSAEFTGKWTLYAVYSRNIETAKAFAEKNNAEKYYTDLSELASDKNIDAVYIGSPNALHYEQSKMMMRSVTFFARKTVMLMKRNLPKFIFRRQQSWV